MGVESFKFSLIDVIEASSIISTELKISPNFAFASWKVFKTFAMESSPRKAKLIADGLGGQANET